jgi:hypothetical protein
VPARTHQPLFSMSAFNGLLAVRRYLLIHSATSMPDVVLTLKRLSPDDAYHDYETAILLNSFLPQDVDHSDIAVFFRQTLSVAIQRASPWWTRLASYGRNRLRAALTENEQQCFEAAHLFSPAPSSEILKWWDALAQDARAAENDRRLAQGREAELLTISYETDRLSRLGITTPPRWIALDDNNAGYDVHSFDPGPVAPIAKLIEVKSCAREDREIFLTQNEWNTALERAPHYRFHIWFLPEQSLIELTTEDLAPHVPRDCGTGRWQTVRITLTAL